MRAIRMVAAVAMLLGGVSMSVDGNAATRKTIPSQIRNVDEVTSGNEVVQITGRVVSRRADCVSGRTLRAVIAGAAIFYGTGVSDSTGAFAINGTGPRDVDYKITLKRSRVGGSLCGGDVHIEELG